MKYNAQFASLNITESSYIRKYLSAELETMLNPESNSIHNIDLDSLYVNMPQIEMQLEPFTRHMDSDRCVFLTGLTGCGKSSVLNHMFHVNLNSKLHIANGTLFVLFSFDHAIAARERDSVTTYFINIIKETCETIKNVLDKDGIHVDDNSFFDYIKKVRADNLHHGTHLEAGTCRDRLYYLLDKNPIEFYTLKLKYYLTALEKINHVALIVDDIESVGYQMELVPIDLGLTIWSCFKRQPSDMPKIWSSSVVISCRHYVYRMIQKHAIDKKYIISSGIDSQTLESYPIDEEINIPESVSLIEIIQKRVGVLRSVKSGQRWDDAWRVVENILFKIDDRLGDFILAVCINNIRKSLSVLKKIIFNKRWIQRDWSAEETPGAFNINCIDQFNLSSPCLLRAMAIGEGNIYTQESILPNIFYNTMHKESDLITFLVFKAFLNRSNEGAITWRISLDRNIVTSDIKAVLPVEADSYVDRAIEFLIGNRLLLRSKNQTQDDGLDININNIGSIQHVYVSKGAFALWNQLGRSSVLLELFTDDIYIDIDSFDITERKNFSLFDQDTFKRCINFLEEMKNLEYQIRLSAHNCGLSKKFIDTFGSDFVTSQLYKGLVASRNAYFKNEGNYQMELNRIWRDFLDKKRLLNNYYEE